MQNNQRLHSLDNLRAMLMWLGIVLHSAVNHLAGWSTLPWRDAKTTQVADFITAFIHAFRMPAFFVVAGFFVAMLIEKRGLVGMLGHRLRRIGLPFVVFWPILYFVLTGLIGEYTRLSSQESAGIALGQLPGETDGTALTTLHLWFIYYLLWYCAVTVVSGYAGRLLPASMRHVAGGVIARIGQRWWGILILAALLVIPGAASERGIIAAGSGSFIPEPDVFFHYGLFYAFGLALYHYRDVLIDVYQRRCHAFLFAGVLCFFIAGGIFDLTVKQPSQIATLKPAIAFFYSASSWLLSFALIGLFVRYVGRQNRVLAYLSESSYWVYLVHFVATVGFGVLMFHAPLGALTKIGINIVATTIVCVVSYHLFVRYTWISVLLNGRRHQYRGTRAALKFGVALAVIFAGFIVLSQMKFSQRDITPHATAPAAIKLNADVADFLARLGQAYGSPDSRDVARFMTDNFLHQGMDKQAFLIHLKRHQGYLGKLQIVPLAVRDDGDSTRLVAYAMSSAGPLAPALQLLPLDSGAMIVKENGAWKLRGNGRFFETPLYRELAMTHADFAPADQEVYRRYVPQGFMMPNKPAVRVTVSNWKQTEAPMLPYRSVQLSILVRQGDAEFWHVVAMPETDWLAVESGKTVGLPKSLADIDLMRSLGNAWQVRVREQEKTAVEIRFNPVLKTKWTTFAAPSINDDTLVFGRDGRLLKLVTTDFSSQNKPKTGIGWMSVQAHAGAWKDLLASGARAEAAMIESKAGRKQHLYAINDATVPHDIRQTLDGIADAWTRQDFDGVLAHYHPAFRATHERDIAQMRRQYSMSRSYRWKVTDLQQEGKFAWLRGEVQTDAGVLPAAARLINDDGRWLFYGDGGSRKDKELGVAVPGVPNDSYEADMQRLVRETQRATDNLRFAPKAATLGMFSRIGNTVFVPAGSGPFPAIVFLHGCGGMYEKSLRQWMTAALAKGYAVLAVDSMRGHASNCTMPLKVSMPRRAKDAYDALDHLRTMPMIDGDRIAVTGFSQGSVIALLLASKEFSAMYGRGPRYAAVATVYPLCYLSARYGKHDIEFLRPDTDRPLLALMGGEDTYTPAYDCLFNLQALKDKGLPVDWHVYPKATHGFDVPELNAKRTLSFRGDLVGFVYDSAAAADARQRLLAFLDKQMPKPH